MVYGELLKLAEGAEAKPQPLDEDLPGMGQFYCHHCEYSSISISPHISQPPRPDILLFIVFVDEIFTEL